MRLKRRQERDKSYNRRLYKKIKGDFKLNQKWHRWKKMKSN